MRIVIHDYAGHPFKLQLSRRLASRGHHVLHQFCASVPGPKGRLYPVPGDSPTLTIQGITLSQDVVKRKFGALLKLNFEHGRLAAERIAAFNPDVVLTANTPLEAVDLIQKECWRMAVPHVFSCQDIISVAAAKILGKKLAPLEPLVSALYGSYEQRLFRRADRVIVISDDFRPHVHCPPERVTTIQNWAVLDETPVRDKRNDWSCAHGLDETTNFVYSGTLGMKHNPGLLLRLATEFRDQPQVRVVVVSEGTGIEWLREEREKAGLTNLVLLPYQPMESLPDVLGTADVVVAVLEPSAGVFSVPSKVLSYLCSGRAILLAVPPENLASRIVTSVGAGLCVHPDDEDAFAAAAGELMASATTRMDMGDNGRVYAEATFDIDRIADQFETVFREVTTR